MRRRRQIELVIQCHVARDPPQFRLLLARRRAEAMRALVLIDRRLHRRFRL